MNSCNQVLYVYAILCAIFCCACSTTALDACGDAYVDATNVQTAVAIQDNDRDGVPANIDCDDYNEYTYPGAFELCDYKDNNCDGETDEDWKTFQGSVYGRQCFVTGDDGCPTEGLWLCSFDRITLTCNAQPTTEHVERCNGRDDDCDGLIDEDWPYLHTACTEQIGACSFSGTWECDTYDEVAYCASVDATHVKDECFQ